MSAELLRKYPPAVRESVFSAVEQIADIEGLEVIRVFEEHTTSSVGDLYSNGDQKTSIFLIDDPTCREPIMVFTSKEMHDTIRGKIEASNKSVQPTQ